jgi:hypothetical protein
MKLFQILNIHPIILPELLYRDRFNNINAYFDTNPSIHISESGRVKILVRRINYRKFHDKNFILYQNQSNSFYTLLTGSIHPGKPLNLEEFQLDSVENKYTIPTYPTYWTGLEDIRFIDDSTILTTIPECNPSGGPCIFKAKLTNNTVDDHVVCQPNYIEKNWMPYKYENTNKVIYSLHPFIIKSIDSDDRQTLSENPILEGYHGSSNGIAYKDQLLFLIHKNNERTHHRWILFDPSNNSLKISEPFTFFKHSHIEFTCSLASYNDRIFVSLGLNDNSAYILELSVEEIDSYFSQ